MQRFIIIFTNLIIIMFLVGCHKNEAVLVTEETVSYDITYEMDSATSLDAINKDRVAVYVCGAVVCPGVYYLEKEAIKEQALLAAGGYVEGASTTYVNLAEKIMDGERIYFPFEEELGPEYSPISGITGNGKVNINTASAEELMTLPGIGESKADSIIQYREKYGAFQCVEDITNIPGIKEGIYNNIKDYIVVN